MYHYVGCGRDRRRCGFCGRDGVFAHTISPTKTFRNGNPFVKETRACRACAERKLRLKEKPMPKIAEELIADHAWVSRERVESLSQRKLNYEET